MAKKSPVQVKGGHDRTAPRGSAKKGVKGNPPVNGTNTKRRVTSGEGKTKKYKGIRALKMPPGRANFPGGGGGGTRDMSSDNRMGKENLRGGEDRETKVSNLKE